VAVVRVSGVDGDLERVRRVEPEDLGRRDREDAVVVSPAEERVTV
jgi:hypothetical protein